MKQKRVIKTFSIVQEVLNSVTHGIGVILAIIGTVFLFIKAVHVGYTSPIQIAALVIYSSTLIIFLLMSTLFHALIFTRAARVFQHFDHIGIFLIILGTYTPFIWIFLNTTGAWIVWWVIFGLTILGFIYDFVFIGRMRWLSSLIYLMMGWAIVFIAPEAAKSVEPRTIWLLFIGGVLYSIGVFFYLDTKIWMNHMWWHIIIILATMSMYFSIYLQL